MHATLQAPEISTADPEMIHIQTPFSARRVIARISILFALHIFMLCNELHAHWRGFEMPKKIA